MSLTSGACFLKVSRNADLLTCFYCKKNKEDCEVCYLKTSGIVAPKIDPKRSGRLRNRPHERAITHEWTCSFHQEEGKFSLTAMGLDLVLEHFVPTFGEGTTLNEFIILSGYSSRILEISKVPIPDPVPPPNE